MKTCSKCKEIKPLSEFHNYKAAPDGKQKTCKSCQKAYSQSETCRINRQAYYQRTKSAHINRNLNKQYGISLADYHAMAELQCNSCAICGSIHPHGKGRMHVDHCHTTGKVRGLLCHHCNTMLGLAKDSVSTLQSAIDYVNRHS